MKRLVQYILLLSVIGFSSHSLYQASLPVCSKPLKYSTGIFSPAFGITHEEFRLVIAEAESVWEKELDRDIFVYEPDADFKINLIYDEKQLATVQKQKIESGLAALESEFENIDRQLASLKAEYERLSGSYEKAVASFDQRKSAYDREVDAWNEKGGAPRDEYLLLEDERRGLNTEADKLNSEAEAINKLAERLNDLIAERNIKASEYNRAAAEYNKKYGAGLEFNQAEYTGKEINVYQFGNKRELTLALAHEFGHALGMDHVENPESIMYYLTNADTEASVALSEEDRAELRRVCD